MKFAIHTFGCKVNSYESQYISEQFSENGHELTEDFAADVHIVNSCTVTGYSDKKVRQFISKIRRQNHKSIIILTGCLPQSRIETDSSIDDLDADIITGTKNRKAIYSLFEEYLKNREKIVELKLHGRERSFEPMMCGSFGKKTRANIKIEDGCDNFCSYCIIPYTRGRVRSKTLEDIALEAQQLADAGFKEIVLTGINLSAYGADFDKSLYDAVKVCCDTDSIKRVRLSSLETERLGFDTIEKLSLEKKLCPHFHLSLQSGSDNILRAMNRKYNAAQYVALTDKMKELFENCAITTDIIVGFPSETESDFEKTLEMIERVGFAEVHVFPYSLRFGTKAAKMPQIPDYIKTQRAKSAEEYAKKSQLRYLKSQVGKTLEVLFERENDPKIHTGHTPNYCKVNVNAKIGEKSLQNECFCVKIKEYDNFCLAGEIADENFK